MPNQNQFIEQTEIDDVIETYLSRVRAGESISLTEFAAEYPQLEQELLALIPAVNYLESDSPQYAPRRKGHPDLPDEILGAYQITRLIGIGGMGTVYEAHHELRSQVALKVMRADRISTGDAKRFAQEGQIVATLHHPNIVPVYEVGSVDQLNYMSMRLINGPNLSQVVKGGAQTNTHHQKSIELAAKLAYNWKFIAKLGIQAANAIHYAHQCGVLHRDIKPANLLIDSNDNVWITDFGLAKRTESDCTLTNSGNAVGTLRYMAPEQMSNCSDERTDVYGLGLTLQELLRFACNPVASRTSDQPEKSSGKALNRAPRKLRQIIARAYDREPDTRYQSAQEFETALTDFVDNYADYTKSIFHKCINVKSILLTVFVIAGTLFLINNRIQPKTIESISSVYAFSATDANAFGNENGAIQLMQTEISASEDDVEEYENRIYLDSSDLELVWDEIYQIVGLRFRNATIPKNAVIQEAFVQFQSDEADIGETRLVINGEAGYSEPFKKADRNVSLRTRTKASVVWEVPIWKEGEQGPNQRTPDLAEIIQEIVERPDYQSDEPITLIISGSGRRSAVAYDKNRDASPKLSIKYILDDSTTSTPLETTPLPTESD